jgi:acetyltransferase EpsM
MKKICSILGVGGHGKVVFELARHNNYDVQLIYDDNVEKNNSFFNEIRIVAPIDESLESYAVIAVGDNHARKKISDRLSTAQWITLIHPTAIISDDVEIGIGTVIMAGAIIQPGTRIGNHCIINTGACVDHDCIIGDYTHIAPGSALAGGVTIGEGTFLGIGTSIIPNIKIGNWITIGAGSVVINDQTTDSCTVFGVPAKVIKYNNEES